MAKNTRIARDAIAASLSFVICLALPALAPAQQQSDVDQLSRQLQQMQAELEALKRRDHERNAWEASVMQRLPGTDNDGGPQVYPVFPNELEECEQVSPDYDEEDDNEYERFLTPVVTDCGNITFKPGARIQGRYLYDDSTHNNDFFIRRFRLKAGGNAFDIADYYMELKIDSTSRFNTDPSPDAVVENAWLDFHLAHETHYLRVGLYDIPMSRNALTSDSKLLFMDRTLIKFALTEQGMADNTVGLLLHGRPFCGRLEYSVGIFDNFEYERDPAAFNAVPSQLRESNDLMPAGRVVLHLLDPAEPAKGYADYKESYLGQGQRLAIGANAAYLSNVTDNNFVAVGPDFDLHAWGCDLFFNSGPFVFQAEYDRYDQSVSGAFADRHGDGWYAQAGYIICGDLCCCPCDPVLEIAARYEELDDRDNLFGQNDYLEWTSLGLNLYFRDHNLKIQTDYTWRRERDVAVDNDRFQIQLQFDY